MNIFEQVKESITTKQAVIHYGINVNQNDMVCCPFHNDRHPSMKIAERYYCFGCGEKGDVINFVAKLHNLSQYEAAKKMALDFGLQIEKNTYQNKNIDMDQIFEKGFSGKKNHTGLGLWEIRKIIKKNNNLNLFTSKTDKFFSQQLEIYEK